MITPIDPTSHRLAANKCWDHKCCRMCALKPLDISLWFSQRVTRGGTEAEVQVTLVRTAAQQYIPESERGGGRSQASWLQLTHQAESALTQNQCRLMMDV